MGVDDLYLFEFRKVGCEISKTEATVPAFCAATAEPVHAKMKSLEYMASVKEPGITKTDTNPQAR